MKSLFIIISLSLFIAHFSKGQVLISLLLGDKLNSDKLEFGLDGGMALSNIKNLPLSDSRSAFHLGFYFDIKMKRNLFLHTGVIVKSQMGAKNLSPYPIGDESLDPLLAQGKVKRRLAYFNVPVLIKYKFKSNFYGELGPQLGLRNKSYDEFTVDIQDDDDLVFKNDISDQYKRLDMGICGGFGYRLLRGNGINLGFRYYYGLVDILKENDGDPHLNNVFYLYVGIPIGAGKAEE